MEAGEILVRRGLIDPDQLEKSRQGVGEGTNVVNVAIDLGYVDEDVALRAMAEEVGLDFIDLTQTDVDLTLLETFPTKLIYRQNLFPVARSNGQLEVATSDPFNLYPSFCYTRVPSKGSHQHTKMRSSSQRGGPEFAIPRGLEIWITSHKGVS